MILTEKKLQNVAAQMDFMIHVPKITYTQVKVEQMPPQLVSNQWKLVLKRDVMNQNVKLVPETVLHVKVTINVLHVLPEE